MVGTTGNSVTFNMGKHYEERLVQALIVDHKFAEQMTEILNFDYFGLEYLQQITKTLFAYYDKYKNFPSVPLLRTIVGSDPNQTLREKMVAYLDQISKDPINGDLEWTKENSLEFCRKRCVMMSLEKILEFAENKKYNEIVPEIQKALVAGSERDLGHSLQEDFESRMQKVTYKPIPTPWKLVNDLIKGGLGGGKLGCVCAPTGCHAKGTRVLMYDGTWKKVEDVKVGDQLMGEDSLPRNVLKLVRGRDKMYKIVPNRGKSFIVNSEHILSLKKTSESKEDPQKQSIVNISVKEYLEKDRWFKHLHKLYRPEVISFNREINNFVVDPYHLGLFLGDGCLRSGVIELTTADEEIKEESLHIAKKYNLRIYSRKKIGSITEDIFFRNIEGKNVLREQFTKMGLMERTSNSKFIPEEYKYSSVENRLKLLAGILDTDGHFSSNCYDIVLASKQLLEDVAFVARSCGFFVSETEKIINKETYYRATISGNTDRIPVKIKRKVASDRKQKKNHLMTGFSVEELDVDNYYGFTVDGNNLYVMEDFIVSHNCGKSHALVEMGVAAAQAGFTVVHYTFELSECDTGNRYDSRISNISIDNLLEHKDFVFRKVKEIPGKIIIKSYPTKSASVGTIRNHLHKLKMKGISPDMIVLDYADLMRSRKAYDQKRLEEESVYEELRALAMELEIPIWTATQSNRGGLDAEVITLKDIAECFAKAMICDFFLTLNRKKDGNDYSTIGNLFIAKSRLGRDGVKFPMMIDTSKSKIEVLDPGTFQEDDDDDREVRMKRKLKEIMMGKNSGDKGNAN